MTIKNLHQRKITAARLDQFTAKLDQLEAAGDASDVGRRLAIAQTRSYITEFETELAEFDSLATTGEIPIEDLDHLGEALIRARVASGFTQAQLAERVGLKTAAINRYEANDYRSANLARLAQIDHGLDHEVVDVDESPVLYDVEAFVDLASEFDRSEVVAQEDCADRFAELTERSVGGVSRTDTAATGDAVRRRVSLRGSPS